MLEKIISQGKVLKDTVIFNINVNDKNFLPSLSEIKDQVVYELEPIEPIDVDDVSQLKIRNLKNQKSLMIQNKKGELLKDPDRDRDLNKIVYECQFKKGNKKSDTYNDCSKLKGLEEGSDLNFNKKTGEMFWTPDNNQSGDYSFKISAFDGVEKKSTKTTNSREFKVTVKDFNRPPFLVASSFGKIIDFTKIINIKEGEALKEIDFDDGSITKKEKDKDVDIDLQKINYSCYFDEVIDGVVKRLNECSDEKLRGFKFNQSNGVINWTPDFFQAGTYEFIVVGKDNGNNILEDKKILKIKVDNVNSLLIWQTYMMAK